MDEWIREGWLDDFALFTRVVDHGGFTPAARATGVPQATVSRRIAALERRLGARLLHRSTRRIVLTTVGERAYQHGCRIVAELLAARAAVADAQAEPSGTVRLSAPVVLGQHLLGPALAAYALRCPQVAVVVDLSGRRVDLIAEGVDVALRAGPLPSSSLIARRIGVGEAGLYASPGYLADRGEPGTPSDLPGHRLLHNRPTEAPIGGEAVWTLKHRDGDCADVTFTPSADANEVSVLLGMAIEGAGIARLPTFATAREERNALLRRVLPSWSAQRVDIHAVYPAHAGLTPAARVLIDMLTEHLAPIFS